MLWLGDSIAGAEAPALGAALKASGVAFKNATSSGGGNVVAGEHPVTKMGAKDTWQQLGKNLAEFKPDVVAYQITTYDWGNPAAATRRLPETGGHRAEGGRGPGDRLGAAVQAGRLLQAVRLGDQERARDRPAGRPGRQGAVPGRLRAVGRRRVGAQGAALQGRHPLLPAGLGRVRHAIDAAGGVAERAMGGGPGRQLVLHRRADRPLERRRHPPVRAPVEHRRRVAVLPGLAAGRPGHRTRGRRRASAGRRRRRGRGAGLALSDGQVRGRGGHHPRLRGHRHACVLAAAGRGRGDRARTGPGRTRAQGRLRTCCARSCWAAWCSPGR